MTIAGSLIINILTKTSTGGLDKTDRAIRKTTSSLKKMSESTGLIGKLSQSMFRGFNFGSIRDGFMNYLQFEKDLGAIHSRFYAITKDEQKAKQEFKFIQDVANETATDVKSMADSYSIFFSATSKSLGTQGAKEVFTDWAKVGRVLHLSEYQMERVTYALREMSSKGAIYSQDLRMQIGTHVPNAMGLAQQAAEEMGIKGTQWFETLQKKAKGNAKVTADFVRLFSKYAKQAYGTPEALKKAMQQPDALAQMIANKIFEFGYKFSQAGGGYMIVKILEGVNKLITKIDFDKITTVLGRIARFVGTISDYMPQILAILRDIALMQLIPLLLNRTVKLYKSLQRMLFVLDHARFLWSKSGFKGVAGKFLLKSGGKLAGKMAARGAIAGASASLGIVGIIIDIGLAIWTLVDIIRLFYNMWQDKNRDKYIYKYGKNDYFGDTGLKTSSVFNVLKEVSKRGVTNRDELTKQLSYFGASTLNPYVHLDENHNIYISIDGHNIPISQMQEETKIGIKDRAGNILKRIIKGNDKPKTKGRVIPTISDEEARKYQRK